MTPHDTGNSLELFVSMWSFAFFLVRRFHAIGCKPANGKNVFMQIMAQAVR
jgi:hypothetical protein